MKIIKNGSQFIYSLFDQIGLPKFCTQIIILILFLLLLFCIKYYKCTPKKIKDVFWRPIDQDQVLTNWSEGRQNGLVLNLRLTKQVTDLFNFTHISYHLKTPKVL